MIQRRFSSQQYQENSPKNGVVVKIDGTAVSLAEHKGEWRNLSPARYWWIRNGADRRCCLTFITIRDGGRKEDGVSIDLTDVPTGVLEAVSKYRKGTL